jgi:ATP-binding cassette subfamily B protein AbcA/BmrA
LDLFEEDEERKSGSRKHQRTSDILVKETFTKFLKLGKPYINWYIIMAILTLLRAPLGVLTLEASRRFINAAADKNVQLLYSAITISVIGLAIGICLSFIRTYCNQKLSNQSISGIQKSLFSKLLRTDLSELHSFHTGDLILRMNQSATAAQAGINNKVNDLVGNISQSAIMFIYLFSIHPTLTLYAVFIASIVPLVLTIRSRLLRQLYELKRKKGAELDSFAQDVIVGAETVRTSLLINSVNKIFSAKYNENMKLSKKIAFIETVSARIRSSMSFIAMLFIFGYGGNLVFQGMMDIGALVVFVSSYGRISGPLSGLTGLWVQLQQDIVNAARVFEVYKLRDEAAGEIVHDFDPLSNDKIELINVSYCYKKNINVINEISFTAERDRITAIVGPSGSGKSTLVKLIMGLYAPTSGDIRIGALSIENIAQHGLRQQIAYVPQTPYFFSGTIYENISCGNPEASETEVYAAAKAARIHDFIIGLKNQYQTPIKERGLSLSGGEKQRLAIARALLRNPSIVIMDEPSSALDSENEMHIKETIELLAKGRIVIVITHRLSSIIHADKIIVIENGRRAEEGSFDELMEARGKFHQLYRSTIPGEAALL